jgi:hypothetical protein
VGLNLKDIDAVLKLRKTGYMAGPRSIVELGAQQLSSDLFRNKEWIAAAAEAFGVAPRDFTGPSEEKYAHGDSLDLDRAAPMSREMWDWLGFNYQAIDLDGSPGSIPLDLNFDSVPGYMRNKAMFVTNCGTTEHVANQLNAMKVVHDLTSVGGVMYHHLPCQGFMVHGLINYNPKFFWALSAANGYKWLDVDFRQSRVTYPMPADIVGELEKFQPDALAEAAASKFSDAGIMVVMQKLYDLPFVAPIDVPPGSETANPDLKRRYWTVFDTPRFHALIDEIVASRTH